MLCAVLLGIFSSSAIRLRVSGFSDCATRSRMRSARTTEPTGAAGSVISENLAEEGTGALLTRVRDHLVGVAVLDDLPVVHEDQDVTHLPGEADLVRNDHHRHA